MLTLSFLLTVFLLICAENNKRLNVDLKINQRHKYFEFACSIIIWHSNYHFREVVNVFRTWTVLSNCFSWILAHRLVLNFPQTSRQHCCAILTILLILLMPESAQLILKCEGKLSSVPSKTSYSKIQFLLLSFIYMCIPPCQWRPVRP